MNLRERFALARRINTEKALQPAQRNVLHTMLHHVTHGYECDPSQPYLVKEFGLGEDAVKRAIRVAKRVGMLEVIEPSRGTISQRYRWHVGGAERPGLNGTDRGGESARGLSGPGAERSRLGGAERAGPSKEEVDQGSNTARAHARENYDSARAAVKSQQEATGLDRACRSVVLAWRRGCEALRGTYICKASPADCRDLLLWLMREMRGGFPGLPAGADWDMVAEFAGRYIEHSTATWPDRNGHARPLRWYGSPRGDFNHFRSVVEFQDKAKLKPSKRNGAGPPSDEERLKRAVKAAAAVPSNAGSLRVDRVCQVLAEFGDAALPALKAARLPIPPPDEVAMYRGNPA